ncbi:MAG: hypothetical protein P4N59_16015, partial [Negativicutes bacterium]|nr:hypothetical protein [Negativicutes bacterium]
MNGSNITTDRMTYTSNGMLLTKADALNNTTTYAYDAKGLFPVTITNALTQITTYNYDDNTGVLNHEVDPNGKTTSYQYDEMNNVTSISYPDGGSVGYSYNYPPPTSVTVTEAITATQQESETAIIDGLGRLIHTQLTSDPEGTDYVDTTYDALGRKASVSNPYRTGDPTSGVTQYAYDALNRLITQTEADGSGSVISYSYTGNTTTVTDEAGKVKQTQADGLGRLVTVCENQDCVNYQTTYTYDCLGNLLTVSQQGTNRTFTYDSLSRLKTADNPELDTPVNNYNGKVTYTYDNDGSLISKTDGRGTITYNPDPLHRITSKSYSDSELTIYYCYDNQQSACGGSPVNNGIGRRTGMSDASGTTAWSYDVMGRPTAISKKVGTVATYTDYTYDLDGSIATMFYPDMDIITYQYSNAGRPVTANYDDLGYSFNYVKDATYTASGALTSYQNDSGATVTNSYNKRLQPATISVVTSQGTILNLAYNYNIGSGDNGDVISVTNQNDGTRSQAYTYDPLNRLATYASSGQWGNSYTYDSKGNLKQKGAVAGHSMGESWLNASDANNHMVGYGYDGAGNMNSINGYVYNIFNAENQWVKQTNPYNITYTYDGDGDKVKDSGGASGTRIYAYDAAGEVVEETDQNGGVLNEYLYFG